jgi:hypothetical protein
VGVILEEDICEYSDVKEINGDDEIEESGRIKSVRFMEPDTK